MKRGCTQCGECLNVCPVFRRHRREEYSPKGKRLLMEPVQAGESSFGWDEVFAFARLCAGCGRCKTACARKLSTADLLAGVRAAHPHWTQHLWELWIKHLGPLWPAAGFLASLVPGRLTPKLLESSLETARALLSGPAPAPWVRLRNGRGNNPRNSAARAGDASPVVLFSGCTARNVRPQWTDKAERLLRAWGYPLLDASAFVCCGGTLHHAGRFEAMEDMRRANIAHWKRLGKPRVAVFCASCHHGLAAYGEGSLADGEAEEWQAKLTPLASLLAGAEAETTAAKPPTYGYHQPCHWEKDRDLPFLASVMPGLKKGGGLCCGMGGILKLTDPDLSRDMARECLAAMPEGTGTILTGCSGCAMQLSAYAGEGLAVRHWLDVVALRLPRQ
ncbi:MAG: (Fe-S)-binding protein [Deltaproteobacteria bacterium]|jgi:glycolate oxidase iron-sulfur subunit|nr:(Fe-S)-binding protein [Deltaproteobacteria bacterium]